MSGETCLNDCPLISETRAVLLHPSGNGEIREQAEKEFANFKGCDLRPQFDKHMNKFKCGLGGPIENLGDVAVEVED